MVKLCKVYLIKLQVEREVSTTQNSPRVPWTVWQVAGKGPSKVVILRAIPFDLVLPS